MPCRSLLDILILLMHLSMALGTSLEKGVVQVILNLLHLPLLLGDALGGPARKYVFKHAKKRVGSFVRLDKTMQRLKQQSLHNLVWNLSY